LAWPAGGVLVFEPPQGNGLLPAGSPLPVAAQLAAQDSPLLAEVDLGPVRFGRAAPLEAPAWLQPALADSTGLGLAWQGHTGPSRVIVFTFGLSDTNLTRRAAFPVLVANAVTAVLPPPLTPSLLPGEPVALPSPDLFPQLSLTGPDGEGVSLGPDRANTFTDTLEPGLYTLAGRSAQGETWRASFGVNAGSPDESELRQVSQPVFAPANAASAGAEVPRAFDLWPLLVLLALLALVVEARLAWR
jgi:hypothetical protein